MVERFVEDVRYAARVLGRSPGFAAVAIASLALGIGANTAIFQLLDAVRLRSLPVTRPHELAEIRIAGGNHGMGINDGQYAQLTRPIWQEIRDDHPAFSGVFAWAPSDLRVGPLNDLRRVNGLRVSGEFFRVLGLHPWRGRLLQPEDDAGACPASTAVVSYAYWQSEMGGREIGGGFTLLIDGAPKQIVGITPPAFFGLSVGDRFDVALPFCQPKELRRDLFNVAVMGRLRTGWTIERASVQLAAASPGIFAATAPTGYSTGTVDTYKRFQLAAYPASGGVSALRARYDSSLWLLLSMTGLVLLIACANLANLMLARASTREREMAVRLALGASRGRLVAQMLTESALLAALGATLGVGLAQWLSRVLVWSLSTESASVSLPLDTDWRVLLFAAAVAASTCALFGTVPALRASHAEPVSAMKAGGRGTTGGRERFVVQRAMVVSQIAVSLVLLVGALLFVRSFRNLLLFDPGMREEGISIAFVDFQQAHVAPDHYDEFRRGLLEEVRGVPGVLSAATTTNTPLLGSSWTHGVHVGSTVDSSKFTWVSPGYLQTMGIPLIKGRDFDRNDTGSSQRVAIVNQAFVRRFVGDADPIGKTLRTDAEPNYPSAEYQIVGVIRDTKYDSLRTDTPAMAFAPASQVPAPVPWTAIMMHSSVPPAAAIAAVKRRITAAHPEVLMESLVFQQRIRDGLTRERVMAMLSGFFGLLAALLTMVGLYGVISYVVARRRNEIGIRMALGARRGQVVGMVMRDTGWLLLAGLVTGTVLSLVAGRWIDALLFELKATDPRTLAAAAVALSLIAVVAAFLPARRASAIDPMLALREE